MIKNLTTNTIISTTEIQARSFWSQARGLMIRPRKQNLIMHFNQKEPRTVSLHNFFVFYPLEIIICNKEKQVIEIKHNFKPFTFFTAKQKGYFCIELGKPESKNKCNVGDQLEF